jgi:molybdate transport system ATP-binding protein
MVQIDIKKNRTDFAVHFSLHCKSKRIVLFGPSGSGKSTLLKMLAGLCQPEHGNITMNSRHIFSSDQQINVPVHLRRFGYLPQNYTLFPTMTVAENISYGLRVRKKKVHSDVIKNIALKLGIANQLHCRPSELSGGQQQRTALARILLITPRALLLDEPFSALDRSTRDSLRDLVRELTSDLEIPTLFVTHDLEDAHAFGQEIVIIKDGSVLEYGARNTVLNNPKWVETARLLNFQIFPLPHRDNTGFQTSRGEHFSMDTPIHQNAEYVCIKPENIRLLREDKSNPMQTVNSVSGRVRQLYPRAAYTKVTFCSLKGDEYSIHASNHVLQVMNIHPGKKIQISLKKESLIPCSRRNR